MRNKGFWLIAAIVVGGLAFILTFGTPESVEYGVKLFLFNEGMGPFPFPP